MVFHCADPMAEDGTELYYESIDLEDAFHPQTILAYELNDAALPVANGAPLRLRVERQLGYKHAKYVMRIELVESFAHIAGGKGGYWEDQRLPVVRGDLTCEARANASAASWVLTECRTWLADVRWTAAGHKRSCPKPVASPLTKRGRHVEDDAAYWMFASRSRM